MHVSGDPTIGSPIGYPQKEIINKNLNFFFKYLPDYRILLAV